MHAYMTRSTQAAIIYNNYDKQAHKKQDRKTDLWDRKPWLGEMKLQLVGRVDDNDTKAAKLVGVWGRFSVYMSCVYIYIYI